jgi:hypothetical protein
LKCVCCRYRGKEVVRLERRQYGQWRYQRVEACPRDHREPPSQRRGLAFRAVRRLVAEGCVASFRKRLY